MNAEDKKLLKSVVKRVHPDLFNDLQTEREHNSQSLKALNSYLADISKKGSSKAVVLSFWVKERASQELYQLKTELPAWGSIGPLLYAFELITEDELVAGKGNCSGKSARSVLSWLESSVEKAADAAEEHESLRAEVRNLKASVESKFNLNSVTLSRIYSTSVREQKQHVEALKLLMTCLDALPADDVAKYRDLQIHLHHPLQNDSPKTGEPIEDHVADDGTLHLVADPSSLPSALADWDLQQARLLTQVADFWQRRSRDLVRALRAVLGIQKIWCDSYSERGHQRFVEWAARLLDKRAAMPADWPVHTHNFSLLLHTDDSAPFIEFTPASSMLQVRCDTAPEELLEYLNSTARSGALAEAEEKNKEEEQILERLRVELGLKHAIRVCAASEQENVVNAAKRLLENREQFKAAGINLEGASLAFDNCYEVWESGFISIPHNFKLDDLKPKLQLLLSAPDSQLDAASGHTQDPLAVHLPDAAHNGSSDASVDQAVASVDQAVASVDQAVASSDQVVASSDQAVASSDQAVASSAPAVASSAPAVANSAPAVASVDQAMASSAAAVASVAQAMARSERALKVAQAVAARKNWHLQVQGQARESSHSRTSSSLGREGNCADHVEARESSAKDRMSHTPDLCPRERDKTSQAGALFARTQQTFATRDPALPRFLTSEFARVRWLDQSHGFQSCMTTRLRLANLCSLRPQTLSRKMLSQSCKQWPSTKMSRTVTVFIP